MTRKQHDSPRYRSFSSDGGISSGAIHLTGDYAGMIEVPIVGSTGAFCCDIDELTLRVEGEANRCDRRAKNTSPGN